MNNDACAIIFDVDGPLLHLGEAEQDCFVEPLEATYGLRDVSRDWNSYRVRNDVEIYREILGRYFGREPTSAEIAHICQLYCERLKARYDAGELRPHPVNGAVQLVRQLDGMDAVNIGIATANLRTAARIRLEHVCLWVPLAAHAGCAEQGGPKKDILSHVIAAIGVPAQRVLFIGDNPSDLAAAQANGTAFLGFSEERASRERLHQAGASRVLDEYPPAMDLVAMARGECFSSTNGTDQM